MNELSQQEITQLLADAPLTMPSDVFVSAPSDSAPCATGEVSSAALQAVVNRLNALRRIAGLPNATLDSEFCRDAQYGAVDAFMDDSGDSNIDRVGHRRWQLDPHWARWILAT